MLKKLRVLAFLIAIAAVAVSGCGGGDESERTDVASQAVEEPRTKEDAPLPAGPGTMAMEEAANADRYLLVFFYNDAEDALTQNMRAVFDGTLEEISDRANHIAVDITDPEEKSIVEEFNLSRVPMPLVLSLAPNGAVARGLPGKFNKRQLLESFATPSMEKCLKALQDSKLVLLCVQNSETQLNDAAMEGVWAFSEDPRYAGNTEVVILDPTSEEDAGTLMTLNVDPGTEEAVTVLLIPPGSAVGKFAGATDKAMFVAALVNSNSGCGPSG